MKLATPSTWETQISGRGNKAAVWEDLIDTNSLPFMAMLRNLRNLLLVRRCRGGLVSCGAQVVTM